METTQVVAIGGLGLLMCATPSAAFPGAWKVKLGIFLLAAILVAFAVWTIRSYSMYASLYLFILPLGPITLTIAGLFMRGKRPRKLGVALGIAVFLSFSYGALALHFSNASNAWEGIAHLPTFLTGQQAVRDNLNDPESAIFKGLSLTTYHDHPYLCGEVNARNRMGGFVGFTRFYVLLDEVIPFPFFDNDPENHSFNQYMRTCYGDDWDKDSSK